jgi:hypothetical protein
MICAPGETKVAEHCRKSSSSGGPSSSLARTAELSKKIKESLRSTRVPDALPAEGAKTRSDAAMLALLNRMNDMPECVAECVQSMLRVKSEAVRANVDEWYAKSTTDVKGVDFSRNPFMKRAVLKILLLRF